MEILMNMLLGICLSAAAGFRIFVPFFVLSVTTYFGWIDNVSSELWLTSYPLMIGFGFASVLEIAGYFNPWMDNMLDLISTPFSFIAGSALMFSVLPNSSPVLKWIIALICGGVTALYIRLLSLKARALSSYFPTGIGNRVVSAIEATSSIFVSILALHYPLAAVLFTACIVLFFLRMVRRVNLKAEN